MKTPTVSRWFLLVALLASPAIFAAGKVENNSYAEAVATYVDSAAGQLRSIREAVDSITGKSSDDVKKLYADVYKGLDRCDQLVIQLKTSTQKNFDKTKAEFERARDEMVKSLEAARRVI